MNYRRDASLFVYKVILAAQRDCARVSKLTARPTESEKRFNNDDDRGQDPRTSSIQLDLSF